MYATGRACDTPEESLQESIHSILVGCSTWLQFCSDVTSDGASD